MLKKYNKKNLTTLERERLNEFQKANEGKEVTVYFSTMDSIGMGFKLVATTDKPKQISMFGKFDFENAVDITDYEGHLAEF